MTNDGHVSIIEGSSVGASGFVSNDESSRDPLISVIIPCYNHAAFLPEAIASVIAQSYDNIEIIVVDDGSTDDTASVVADHPSVIYLHQENKGLAAARNSGLHLSTGEYLVFLDADDRLLPEALQAGRECMEADAACAFAFGRFRRITSDGSVMPAPLPRRSRPSDPYQAFLEGNFVEMHATVMYRREILLSVGGFDPRLRECEDYDLYLRITRDYKIAEHPTPVAEYRHHETNMSRDAPRMLTTVLAVLRTQWEYATKHRPYRRSYRRGVRAWKDYYGERMIDEVLSLSGRGRWRQAMEGIETLIRLCGSRTPMVGILYFLPQSVRAAVRRITMRFPSPYSQSA